MKKYLLMTMCLLLVFPMIACTGSKQQDTKTISLDDIIYTVDQQQGTIWDGQDTYHYAADSSGITITYPDDETYTWKKVNGFGAGTCSPGFDAAKFRDPFLLLDVIENASSAGALPKPGHIGIGVFLLLVGIFHTGWPYRAWYLSRGWMYKDAEPSDVASVIFRISGIVAIIMGVLLLLTA